LFFSMPSPVGHLLAGAIVHAAFARDRSDLMNFRRAVPVLGAAVVADVDLLFRWFDPQALHQGPTHGIGSALLAGLVVLMLARLFRANRWIRLGLAVATAWGSHILLDWLNVDSSVPIGLMALWPFDDAYYKASWPVLLDIGRQMSWEAMCHNAVAVAWEMALLGPLALGIWRWRARGPAAVVR